MLRHPVQLTSLEEDFKKLGLLNEQEEIMTQTGDGPPAPIQRRGPSGKPATTKTGSREVGAHSEGEDDEGKDGNDTVPGHQGEPTGAGPTKPALPTTPGAQKESITGGDPRRQRLRGEAEGDDEEEEDDDEDEDERDEERELDGSLQAMEAVTRLRGGSPKTEAKKAPEGRKSLKESQQPADRLGKVAELIEDVNSIMESIDTSRRGDAVRAFANSAIISEMLARGFATFAEEYSEADFASAAEAFALMSENASDIAHALEEGEEIDSDALQDEFRAQMDAMMEGLDLYSDVVEADAELEEEEGLDEEEEEVEEETEGEQEEATASTIRKFGAGKKRKGGVGTYKLTTGRDQAPEGEEVEEETDGEQTEMGGSMAGSSYRKKMKGKGVGTYKLTTGRDQAPEGEEVDEETEEEEVEEAAPMRATGGIASQRVESYFRGGHMGPKGPKKRVKEMHK